MRTSVSDDRTHSKAPSSWRLEIQRHEPLTYSLYSSHWMGPVSIKADKFSGEQVRAAIMDQANFDPTPSFLMFWDGFDGFGGMGESLLLNCTSSSDSATRTKLWFKILATILSSPLEIDTTGDFPVTGIPARVPSGDVYFIAQYVRLAFDSHGARIKTYELTNLLRQLGVKTVAIRGRSCKMLSKTAIDTLNSLAQ